MTKRKPVLVVATTALFFGSAAGAQARGRPSWCASQGSLNLAERTICETRKLWDLDYQ
jgi:hypothetical protein